MARMTCVCPRCLHFLLLLAAPLGAGESWPEFRGPHGDGRSDATSLPLAWSEKEGVVWKTAIHDRGWSTPVVHGEQVWITTASEDGRKMFAVCVDRASGKVQHDLLLFENGSPEPLGNDVNCYASPSPAIEEGRVYVHFGSYGTACLETGTGRKLWERRDLPCRHLRGPGSSPVLFEDLLILTMDGFDLQYVVALDKRTGRKVWKADRSFDFSETDGDLRKAYSTPLFIGTGDRIQMISSGSKATYAYDPRSGRELWKVLYDGFSNASRPVYGEGLVFVNTGFGKADLWAVRPDGSGDVTASHIAWKCVQAVPLKPSPVYGDGLLFMVNDAGIASCIEARTGKAVWRERIGGSFSASPILAAGRVYFLSQEGKATVVEAGRSFRVLAESQLDDGFMASPAVAGKALFLRTRSHLYRIEG